MKQTDQIKLTGEDLLAAKTYLSLQEKMTFVETVAEGCLDRWNINASDGASEMPMAPMYKEDTQRRSRYMMWALASLYLGKTVETGEEEFLMTTEDYDAWAGSHVFGQLERLKAVGGETRTQVFDLLADYRDLERRLSVEIRAMLDTMNDPLCRFIATMQAQTTPGVFQKGAAELEQITEEIKKLQEKKAARMKEG